MWSTSPIWGIAQCRNLKLNYVYELETLEIKGNSVYIVANDLFGTEEGPSLIQQVELLEKIEKLANEAEKVGDVFISDAFQALYKFLKERIVKPESSFSVSNKQASVIIKSALQGLSLESPEPIKKVLCELIQELDQTIH